MQAVAILCEHSNAIDIPGIRSNTKSETNESCVRLSRKQGQSIEKSKKLEEKGGGRMVKGIHTSGFDTEAAGSQETSSGRTEAAESQRGKGPDNFQRQSVKEKIQVKAAGELLCFYINARKLLNKFDDFEAWIHDIDPDIVGVTESWATPSISDSELTLQGYDLFRQDRPVAREGGGVLLYVKHRLRAVQCELTSKFPEQVWCYFQDTKKTKCYVGVCYRTPTVSIYGSENHDLLQSLINELGVTKKHFMLMGDFNYRILNWPLLALDSNVTREVTDFCDCLEENFFTQHVVECTRQDAILDLVITDEPAMISDMVSLGTFPGSDHNALLRT